MTAPTIAEQIAWAIRQHMYAETDLKNSTGGSDYSVQCAAAALTPLESVPAMLAVIEAARKLRDAITHGEEKAVQGGLYAEMCAALDAYDEAVFAALPPAPEETT